MTKIKIFVLILIWIILGFILIGCKSAPEHIEGEPAACYDARYCIYLCGEDGDKAICADYVKECSNTRIYQECKEDDNFQGCWDKLQ